MGHVGVMRWNPRDKWIVSDSIVHTPLIDDETFTAAQDLLAARGRGPTEHQTHRTRNHYIFRGKMICGLCSRKMQGQQTHGEPYYRCRYPEEYALANHVQHPRNVILREADLIAPLDTWLTRAFAPHRLEATITAMIDAADTGTENDAQVERARRLLRECDAKLTRYRAALDAGGDPVAIAEWTNEVKAQKIKAQAQLRTAPRRHAPPSRADIKALITGLGDLTKPISGATLQEKAAVYHALGIQGTYHPAKRRVRVEANLDPHLADAASPRWEMVRGLLTQPAELRFRDVSDSLSTAYATQLAQGCECSSGFQGSTGEWPVMGCSADVAELSTEVVEDSVFRYPQGTADPDRRQVADVHQAVDAHFRDPHPVGGLGNGEEACLPEQRLLGPGCGWCGRCCGPCRSSRYMAGGRGAGFPGGGVVGERAWELVDEAAASRPGLRPERGGGPSDRPAKVGDESVRPHRALLASTRWPAAQGRLA
jgi:hypothetical protein